MSLSEIHHFFLQMYVDAASAEKIPNTGLFINWSVKLRNGRIAVEKSKSLQKQSKFQNCLFEGQHFLLKKYQF